MPWSRSIFRRKDREFSRAEFERRIETFLFGMLVWTATAEDTVLAKLEWASMSGSDRQLNDAATVIAVGGDAIDQDYLDHWAAILGVAELLALARSR